MIKNLLRAMGILALAAVAQAASALPYTYDFRTEFSGGTPPDGTAPWATLSFQDLAGGGVSMNLSLSGLTAPEHVKDFYFNYGGSSALTFKNTGSQPASISTGSNAFKGDGDGYYDVKFDFPTRGNLLFGAGESTSYEITASSVSLGNFDTKLLCGKGCGYGPRHAALHVQNTGANNDGSGWIGAIVAPVPEPKSYAMMLAALGVVGVIARRRLRQR